MPRSLLLLEPSVGGYFGNECRRGGTNETSDTPSTRLVFENDLFSDIYKFCLNLRQPPTVAFDTRPRLSVEVVSIGHDKTTVDRNRLFAGSVSIVDRAKTKHARGGVVRN